jgi:hypothetical protein
LQIALRKNAIYNHGYDIRQLRLDNALDRADGLALGRIVMTFTLYAGFLIDYIQNPIAFANRFGWTFRYACATGDAVIKNFHGHGYHSYSQISCGYKLSPCHGERQLTNIFYLVDFVTNARP